MKFQVRKFLCEMSLDDGGRVETRWFDGPGRRIEPPMYLDRIERRQYRAARESFLRAAGKAPAKLPSGADSRSWGALRPRD